LCCQNDTNNLNILKVERKAGWIRVQIKAFISWMNGYLDKREMPVHDLKVDLSDGVRLINFVELLGGKEIKQRYDKKPSARIQKIQNLNIALQFIDKNLQVKLVGISAEDFADGNLKLILGFLWTTYKKYRIATIKVEDKSSEEGLLLWVRKRTEGYDGVNVESYRQGFRNGKAFLALCDNYLDNKEVLDYSSFDKSDPNTVLAKAFETAEKNMGIPRLLEKEEVSEGNVDERSLVLYISLFFHAFVAKEQQKGMNEEKERLAQHLKGLQGSLEERAQLSEKLDAELKELQSKYQKLQDELAAEKASLAEYKEKDAYLEEKVGVLKGLLEQENEEKEELTKELAETKKALEEEQNKNKELQHDKKNLEGKVSSLEGQVSSLTNQLESERASRKKLEEEYASRSKVQVNGLGVMKKNLEEHIEDLHRWEKYLDIQGDVDFEGTVRPSLLLEINESQFDEQLNYLSKKLSKENEELLKMLKEKEAEQKAKKAQQDKKKKPAKK